MKYFCTIGACAVLIFFASASINNRSSRSHIEAQESPKENPVDSRSKSNRAGQEASDQPSDLPYPAFYVNDVVAKLKSAAEEMIEKKLTKNSDELREQLGRDQYSTKLPRAFSKELTPQELYRRATESVFLVAGMTKPTDEESAWKTSFSTAFAVHEDGILSTSAHVFDHDDHDDAVIVLDVRGKIHPVVELLAVNRQTDTCLFRIATKGLKALPLGQELPPGSAIRVMGHPGDSFFFFSAGHIGNYERDEEGLTWLNITADFGQGSSGGPVMDSAGNVVGQVSRTYTLYASGDTSSRGTRPRRARQAEDTDPVEVRKNDEPKDAAPADHPDPKKTSDPQMVFKACTPVTAIRALVK